jgi:hypothetical protein
VGGEQARAHLRDLGDGVGLVRLLPERAFTRGRPVALVDGHAPGLVGHHRRLHRGIRRPLQAREEVADAGDLGLLGLLVLLGLLDLAPRRVVGLGHGRAARGDDRGRDGSDGDRREDGRGLDP